MESTENFVVVKVDGKKARVEALKPNGDPVEYDRDRPVADTVQYFAAPGLRKSKVLLLQTYLPRNRKASSIIRMITTINSSTNARLW